MNGPIFDYLRTLKGYIRFSVRLLILSVVVGVYVAAYHEKETQAVIDWAADALSGGMDLSRFELFSFLFKNNVTALFYALIESLVFGISAVTMIIANGVIIGVFMVLVVKKASFLYFILGIVPHGIFEIPAAIIASSMGMKIGSTVMAKVRRKNVSIIDELYDAVKYFILLVVPLLFVAAFVESFITPVILSLA
ncbi:MAG: stage II sporulation protein M [Candidatus Paceibacterota bacterium]|jgi:stage II sporulation protein M